MLHAFEKLDRHRYETAGYNVVKIEYDLDPYAAPRKEPRTHPGGNHEDDGLIIPDDLDFIPDIKTLF
jgi:hypothetical protein